MKISRLLLTNFRNYPKRTLSFDPELTLVVGPNGSGKTNILEAIYLLATGESWRGETTEEMIGFGEEVGHVSGVISENSEHSDNLIVGKPESQKTRKSDNLILRNSVSSGSQSFPSVPNESTLHMTLSRGAIEGKRVSKIKYKVDGVAKRKSDFVGRLKVVLFEPQSLMIVIGDPSYRRAFLDDVLSKTDSEYRNDLHVYTRALKVRNRLLDAIREGKTQRESLEYWERAMVKHGERLQETRRKMVEWLNGQIVSKGQTSKGQTFKGLTFFGLELEYGSSPISNERLEQYREREIAAGFSLIGPQRDDVRITTGSESWVMGRGVGVSSEGELDTPSSPSLLYSQYITQNSRLLSAFGSRGEQRMAVLKLKLAEARWIEEKTGEPPVLLLDDIYSELDDEHDQMVGELVRGRQTIITATEIPGDVVGVESVIKLDL